MNMYCMTCGEPYDWSVVDNPCEYDIILNINKSIMSCRACNWHKKEGMQLKRYADAAITANDIMGHDFHNMVILMNAIVNSESLIM